MTTATNNIETPKTFGDLTIGTVINYYCGVQAADDDYVVLEHYTDDWGNWTKFLDKEDNGIVVYPSHSEIKEPWSIVKIN